MRHWRKIQHKLKFHAIAVSVYIHNQPQHTNPTCQSRPLHRRAYPMQEEKWSGSNLVKTNFQYMCQGLHVSRSRFCLNMQWLASTDLLKILGRSLITFTEYQNNKALCFWQAEPRSMGLDSAFFLMVHADFAPVQITWVPFHVCHTRLPHGLEEGEELLTAGERLKSCLMNQGHEQLWSWHMLTQVHKGLHKAVKLGQGFHSATHGKHGLI